MIFHKRCKPARRCEEQLHFWADSDIQCRRDQTILRDWRVAIRG